MRVIGQLHEFKTAARFSLQQMRHRKPGAIPAWDCWGDPANEAKDEANEANDDEANDANDDEAKFWSKDAAEDLFGDEKPLLCSDAAAGSQVSSDDFTEFGDDVQPPDLSGPVGSAKL